MHHRRQQCLVAEWLGLSVTVRVRVRAGPGNVIFFRSFLFFCVKVTNTFVLHVITVVATFVAYEQLKYVM